MTKTELCGALIIDKPRGPTSHDVVARLRKALGTREIGHAGTLDPMATGVLVVAIGQATKLVPWLTAEEKAYEATVALGVATDTLDADGKETERVPVSDQVRLALQRARGVRVPKELRDALAKERARTEQVPPAFSAIHAGGERAHEKARRGEEVELAPRAVDVKRLDLLDAGADAHAAWLTVSVHVSKGYYVRSLARDLAAALGTVGHLTALRRVRSGSFRIEEALPLDTPGDELAARVIPIGHAATRALPAAFLTDRGTDDARHGRAVRSEDLEPIAHGPHAWFDARGKLIAIGEVSADRGQVLRGFAAIS